MKTVIKFFNDVKYEMSKVTWLSRKETLISSGIVVVVVTIFALLFLLVDYLMFKGVGFLVGL